MNEMKSGSQNEASKPTQGSGIARRRLLRAGLAATPVILAVSGRSAMATSSTTPVGLSPMAWASVAPNGTYVGSSHTVNGNPLGRSPGFWTPNTSGSALTFQSPKWPVAPFDAVMTKVGNGNSSAYVSKSWNSYPFDSFKGVASTDAGFANGAKFSSVFASSDTRSFSRILLDESASGNINWHFCAAYLNVMAFPGSYAITLSELTSLYSSRQLVPGGSTLTDGQIKAFLDQTWN